MRAASSISSTSKRRVSGKPSWRPTFRVPLRKIYFACSGDASLDAWPMDKPATAGLLDGLVDPDPAPPWMRQSELADYIDAFRTGGFRGPLNHYRAEPIDFKELASYAGKPVTQPSFFIGGERDPVRHFVPGRDLYKRTEELCWKVGDGGIQAADLISATSSIPSLNLTPLMTLGN